VISYLTGQDDAISPTRKCALVPQEKFLHGQSRSQAIINPKLVWPRWLDIGLVLFSLVYGPHLSLGPYPAILTSLLVNNPLDVHLKKALHCVVSP